MLDVEQQREANRSARVQRRQQRAAAKIDAAERREARYERQVEEDQARERNARIECLVNFFGNAMDRLEYMVADSPEAKAVLALVQDVVSDTIDDELEVAMARLMPQSAG